MPDRLVLALVLSATLALAGCGSSSSPKDGDDGGSGSTALPGDAVDEMAYLATDSGLVYYVIRPGDGPKPKRGDKVRVHYTGWQKSDGEKFDSSVDRDEPFEFEVGMGRVIKGWDEGLALMPVGSKYKLVIPASMAYGDDPGGGRPGGVLVFDVELLEIVSQ